jgi:hypothetical protein
LGTGYFRHISFKILTGVSRDSSKSKGLKRALLKTFYRRDAENRRDSSAKLSGSRRLGGKRFLVILSPIDLEHHQNATFFLNIFLPGDRFSSRSSHLFVMPLILAVEGRLK